MILHKHIFSLQNGLQNAAITGKRIGFIPTLGALHKGHLSLIMQSKKECDVTVCSIFINPAQFNDKDDFEKYPRTIEHDILMLEQAKTDILFYPSIEDIYPNNEEQFKNYNLGYLENILEGHYRPGHFQGVCRVVHQFLKIINPHFVYLGMKDYQQCLVLRKMNEELDIPVNIKLCSTMREYDGLAMSSRNFRLNETARINATAIYKALSFIKQNINNKDIAQLKAEATAKILKGGFTKVDYVEICDAVTLKPVTESNNTKQKIALAAAFINDVRLIDNLLLN